MMTGREHELAAAWERAASGLGPLPELAPADVLERATAGMPPAVRAAALLHHVTLASLVGQWDDFTRLWRRAQHAIRHVPDDDRANAREQLCVARLRWHLAVGTPVSGRRAARRLTRSPSAWLRHVSYSALGVWAARERRWKAASRHLESALRVIESGEGVDDEALRFAGPVQVLHRLFVEAGLSDGVVAAYGRTLARWVATSSYAARHSRADWTLS